MALTSAMTTTGTILGILGWLTGDSRIADQASELLSPMKRVHHWNVPDGDAYAGLGFVALARKDADLQREVYGQVSTTGARFHVQVPGVPFSVDRLLGLLARADNRHADTERHFEDAVAFCRLAGYLPELAMACHDYAEMLIGASRTVDQSKAKSLVDEGAAIADRLPIKLYQPRFAALRERLASRRGGRPEYPDGLTEREIEVLHLVAAGKSNREISNALVISENTVIRHIANIFTKTGSANRTEAAGYAHRKAILDDPSGGPAR
jgi:DNA-binding CsgD family transcriptional regulator